MQWVLNYLFAFVILSCKLTLASRNNILLDSDIFENVLDSEECARQLAYIRENDTTLGYQFMDSSWRLPRSILKGNTRDGGNYFQCLDISKDAGKDMQVQGKYCIVRYPTDLTNITLPGFPWPDFMPIPELGQFGTNLGFTENMIEKMRSYERVKNALGPVFGHTAEKRLGGIEFPFPAFELASCIPQVCTAQEALDFFTRDATNETSYEEVFCRLPNDRPWAAIEIVALVIFSLIGLLAILSTAYDIRHTIFLQKDPKKANRLCLSFSIYTNTKNFFVFPSGPGVITCLDGIRTFAMSWVILGHTYGSFFLPENLADIVDKMRQFTFLWVTSAPLTVDTFFLLGGLLVVYITASKMTRRSFIKNLHFFYLNRILRMFPVLAVGILLIMSFAHRTIDGPYLHELATNAENCRNGWWKVLLYVQNWVNPDEMCIPQSWYMAIDMQLYVLSPLVLIFVIGQRKRIAWSVLVSTFVAVTIGASVYNFLNDFPSHPMREGPHNYTNGYYINTLARAGPYILGMLLGYILHLYREKKFKIPMIINLALWVLAFACTTVAFISTYWVVQESWDNQFMDNMINSYKRLIWAAGVGWMIFACHNGYGGPINWVLSLYVCKILGRLSYAMYILHYLMIYLTNATTLGPIYYNVTLIMYRFIVNYILSLISAFLVTIFVDMPCANLINMAMGGFKKKKSLDEKNPGTKNLEDDSSPREQDSENKLKV